MGAWLAYNFPFVTEDLVKKPVVLWYFSQPLVPLMKSFIAGH